MNEISNQNNRIDVLFPAKKVGRLGRILRLVVSPRALIDVLKKRIFGSPEVIEWDSRVKELGAYSVIDTRHAPEEYEYVTNRQKQILFPLLKSQLLGHEKTILDFGCGPGRFTQGLAELIQGHATGTDVTKKLITLAEKVPNVTFVHSKNFFQENKNSFDVIWVCLVLGGIPDAELKPIIEGIVNSLSKNGLLFLVESTGEVNQELIWRIRTKEKLMSLFPSVNLKPLGSYYDVDQEISVVGGRKF